MRDHGLSFVVLTVAGWMNRRQQAALEYIMEENRVLRDHLGGRRLHFTDRQRRRLAVKGRALGRKVLGELACVAAPDTILRWYRQLIARKYDGSTHRGPGRPRIAQRITALVLRFARDNPRWGYERIRGALHNLGHDVCRTTIQRTLAEHGIEPAPERGRRTRWSTFLRAHWGAIAATDFFTVEVLTLHGLVRYHVLFVIDLKSRRVAIAGISHQPHGAWMRNVAKGLLDQVDGFVMDTRYLIHDRDPLFSTAFRNTLALGGVHSVQLPARSPNLNAYAERFVRSIKEECLNQMVLLGERHLRTTVCQYVEHYHLERNHQGLGNALVEAPEPHAITGSPVLRRKRLGGMLSYYYREAA